MKTDAPSIQPPPAQVPVVSFDRPKLMLFKFLAHQIHPFAFAVNTFLRPALDDCLTLLHINPQDTFNVLLSLTQTFTRFAPDSELIYDDIQQFAVKLKDAIDECFTWLDPNTIRQSSQLLETTHQSLSAIIQHQNANNTPYTTMYKNMSAALTNLEKVNSLPMEMQAMSFGIDTLDKTVTIQANNKQQPCNGQTGLPVANKHQNGNGSVPVRTTLNPVVLPPPGMPQVQVDKPLSFPIPTPSASLRQPQPPPPPPATTTTNMGNQLKNLSVFAIPPPASISLNTNNSTAPTLQPSSRSVSTTSYMSEYEVMDTSVAKKPTPTIAAFPPRQNSSLFTSTEKPLTATAIPVSTASKSNLVNGHSLSALLNGITASNNLRVTPSMRMPETNNQTDDNISERDTPTPTPSNDDGIRFGTTPGPYSQSIASSVHGDNEDEFDEENGRQYYTNPRFFDPIAANAEWRPTKASLSIVLEQSRLDQTMPVATHPHITDEYLQEFGNKQTRPTLRGELCMTFGTPQVGPQSDCMPIGVGLSYDELTLLSCDVHRSAQSVRLFDIQTGRLRHTIASNQQMKFHRPSAVMSNARNQILVVERDFIYVVEPDGRFVQQITHRSIKQLYGIALFRDRYLLTIDSKATDHKTAEKTRLVLFDPMNGQMVWEQWLKINQEPEESLRQQTTNHIQGRILPETMSKPRFLAVHNDSVYIADLGRSLIYGTSIHGQFDLNCTTVFGGHGRANGEMIDPSGLLIDSGGNIVSADSKNDRIQLYSSDGQYKTTLKLNERIKRPSGLCSNRAGTQFYVSCYLAGCVRAFNIGY